MPYASKKVTMSVNRQKDERKLHFKESSKKVSPESAARKKRIAANLKRLRESVGILRQQDLADRLGLSRNYIGRLESGHASFGSEAEEKFAAFYNVDISEFYKEPNTDLDLEIELLRKEVLQHGGAEKVRRLRQMMAVLFNDDDNEEKSSTVPRTAKNK